MRKVCFIIVLIITGIAPLLHAQQEKPFFSLNFSRQNNFTWTTTQDLWYTLQKGRYSLDATIHHDNIYNETRTHDPFVQLYLRSSIWNYYQMHKRLDFVNWIETDQFISSQNQKINVYSGLRYRPGEWLNITPLIGYSWDTRDGVNDAGISPAVKISSAYPVDTGITMITRAFLRAKYIHPRHQRNLHASHVWWLNFGQQASILTGISAGSHELDDYVSQSVQQIKSDSVSPFIRMNYQVAPWLVFRTDNNLSFVRRHFEYERLEKEGQAEFNDLSFNGMEAVSRQELMFFRKKWELSASYQYEFFNRKYHLENSKQLIEREYLDLLERERTKDYIRKQHTWGFSGNWQWSARHNWFASVTNRYLQYDTPSEMNDDDRDELSLVGGTGMRSNWSSSFRTEAEVSGTWRHYAFLFQEKSQDNYIQRSLRLDFRYFWKVTDWLAFRGDNAIYVMYNVKDFGDLNKTDRSTRNLETNVTALMDFSDRMQSTLSLNRKETHNSYLNWEEYTETTLDTNRITIIESSNRYHVGLGEKFRGWIDVGYKHFQQERYQNTSMINLENRLVPVNLHQQNYQTGPVLAAGLHDRRNSAVELSVWMQYQIRHNKYREIADFTTLTTTYYEEDLQKPYSLLRPFLTLKVLWFF